MNKKRVIILGLIVVLMTVAYLFINIAKEDTVVKKDYTEIEMRAYQDRVVRFAQDNDDLDWMGCGVQTGENGYYVYLELRQHEGVDYDLLKESIYHELGARFPLEFDLIPMPDIPTIEGMIRHIEMSPKNKKGDLATVLVISDTVFIGQYQSPDATQIAITDKTLIVDKDDKPLTFDQLQVGVRIESYYRGMTLDTYPSQQGSEKIVVDLDYQTRRIEALVEADTFTYKFKGEPLSQPFYFAFGYDKSLTGIGDYNQIWLHMAQGLIYYHLETLQPLYYEGEIIIYVRLNNEDILAEPYIFESTMVPVDFIPVIEDVDSDGYYEIFIPYYNNHKWLEKAFKIMTDKIIRDADNDRKIDD